MGVERLITNNHLTINDITKRKITNNDKLLKNNIVKSLIVNKGYNIRHSKRGYSPQAARTRADYLAKKLNDPNSLPFYLKCAWNLTDNYLDRLLHISLTKNNAARYFSYVAAKEMRANM